MKTTLPLLFLFFVFFQVRAQESITEVPTLISQPKVDVAAENRLLMRRLLLNETQYQKIEELNKERHATLDAIAKMYNYSSEQSQAKVEELEWQYDAEFEAVLTKQQFADYLAFRGRSVPKEEEEMIAVATPDAVTAPDSAATEASEPKELSFNDKIHLILEKARAPKIDSALIARQDSADFKPLTPEEQAMLDGLGLLPQNATLLAIRADSVKKQEQIALENTPAGEEEIAPEVAMEDTAKVTGNEIAVVSEPEKPATDPAEIIKPDGECKTCYAVDPETNKKEQTTDAAGTVNEEAKEIVWEEEPIKINENEKPVLSETENTIASETAEPELKEAEEIVWEEDKEEAPANKIASAENEELLAIPSEEVEKLRQSLTPDNGTDFDEKTALEQTEPETSETPVQNKLLAEELEP